MFCRIYVALIFMAVAKPPQFFATEWISCVTVLLGRYSGYWFIEHGPLTLTFDIGRCILVHYLVLYSKYF